MDFLKRSNLGILEQIPLVHGVLFSFYRERFGRSRRAGAGGCVRHVVRWMGLQGVWGGHAGWEDTAGAGGLQPGPPSSERGWCCSWAPV